MAKGNTFNVSGDDDIFGNMSDEDDEDIGFNLDGSSSSDNEDDDYNASSAHTTSNNAGNSSGDDLFDDDIPDDSEDSDPFVDPNDADSYDDDTQQAPAPAPSSGRKPGRPKKNAQPQSNQPVNNQQQPAQPDYSQQNYDYNNMQTYPTDGNDGMQGYGNYDPNQQYAGANNQGYPQQNANDFDPSQYASAGYGNNYDPNQYYGNANNQQPQQNAGNYVDNSQQYPMNGNDGMQGYGNYDPNQQYAGANQGYPQQPDYSQQYAQNQPQQDNPFASNNAQPDANNGMNAWPQQDYSQQYGGAPIAPAQNQPQQQPASASDASQSSPFGGADSSSTASAGSYSSSWSSASITIPQPEMIFRIIKVSDMLRDNLSGDEKKAVKLVFNMTAVKIDELSEMVYAVLNARKSIMTALDEFLNARNMDASKRVFYLIRLDDNDLNIISELGAQFGAEITLDKSKKDHYATSELAERAVSTTPDSSIDLMQTVLNVYNASKDIMKNG